MLVSLCFGVEKATRFRWLQKVSFEEPWQMNAFKPTRAQPAVSPVLAEVQDVAQGA